MDSLFADWSEFLSLLLAHKVRFLLIGGHAVAVHGTPRYTEDLDVLVEPTVVNAGKLRAALVEFGFGSVVPAVAELAARDKVFMLGRKPYRIDVLTGIDGVSFRKAWAGRLFVELVPGRVPVIGRAELLVNKRAAGRPKDLADIAILTEVTEPKRRRKPALGPRPMRTGAVAKRKR